MKVKLSLHTLDFEALAHLGASVHTGLSTHAATFAAPNPSLATLEAAVQAVRDKLEARTLAQAAAMQATQELYAAAATLKALLRQEAAYVENRAAGDATIITQANMSVCAQPATVGPLPKAQDLKLVSSDHPGTVAWTCRPVPGARAYLLSVCMTDPNEETNWRYADTATKASGTLTGLAPGKVWVRVVAKGSNHNSGPPSDVALEMVR